MLAQVQNSEEYELFCRGELRDPYPFFRALREEDPVHWSERLNSWVLTPHQHVSEGLRDHHHLSSGRMGLFIKNLPEPMRAEYSLIEEHISRWMVMIDRPRHADLRRLVNKAFTPREVQKLEPQVRRLCDELIDAVVDARRMDLIGELCYPLPASVIATMLGVPTEDREKFKVWSDKITSFLGGSRVTIPDLAPAAHESLTELIDYMREMVRERRRHPREDLTSALLGVEDEGDRLSEEDVVAMCNLLLVAGHETTTGLLGNGLLLLLLFPDQRRRLETDPSLIDTAIEEMLRHESPLQRQTRLVKADYEIDGHRIREGQSLVLLQGAANRDPAVFPDPDRFDVGRTENNHVSFGKGIHLCLGAPLARMEARVAIPLVLERLPGLRLASSDYQWRRNVNFRSLTTLPVEF